MQHELNAYLLSLGCQLAAQHQHVMELRRRHSTSCLWGEKERRTLCLECRRKATWKTTGIGVGSKSLQEIEWEQLATQAL